MSDKTVTEQKRHELVVSPLFNLTFMPSLLLLPDSLLIYRATDAATRVLGYSHDELQQRTLYDLLVEPREQVDAALQRARTQPPFVLTARRPNREERIIEGIVHLLDEYALLHFSFADLTDLHLPAAPCAKLRQSHPTYGLRLLAGVGVRHFPHFQRRAHLHRTLGGIPARSGYRLRLQRRATRAF
jgi:hypothetical protein